MATPWRVRPGRAPATVDDVLHPHPRGDLIDVGDEVVLYCADHGDNDDVYVRVEEWRAGDAEGEYRGTVTRANRPGARGDDRLAKGAGVTFDARHVFRLVKGVDREPPG